MKLTEKYSIAKEAHGFSLVEKTEVKVTKDGKVTGEIKNGENKRYHSSVYQTLQCFLRVSVDESENIEDVIEQVKEATEVIDKASVEIEKRFKLEVLKA